VLLAEHRVAGGVGLDEVGKVSLQVFEHRRGGVVGVGDEAEVDDLLGFLVADKVGERRGVGGLVEEVASGISRHVGGCGGFSQSSFHQRSSHSAVFVAPHNNHL
jgi:hypothetical protein